MVFKRLILVFHMSTQRKMNQTHSSPSITFLLFIAHTHVRYWLTTQLKISLSWWGTGKLVTTQCGLLPHLSAQPSAETKLQSLFSLPPPGVYGDTLEVLQGVSTITSGFNPRIEGLTSTMEGSLCTCWVLCCLNSGVLFNLPKQK